MRRSLGPSEQTPLLPALRGLSWEVVERGSSVPDRGCDESGWCITNADFTSSAARVGEQLSELTAALAPTVDGGLDPERVVRFAARALASADCCALTLVRGGRRPRTIAATDQVAAVVDRLQDETREGPCVSANGDGVELSGDVAADDRWPAFGPRCVERTGLRSVLAARLTITGTDRAALSFYSGRANAFSEADIPFASIFAPFASLAIEQTLRERDATNFEAALSSSRQIGTAIGILMARNMVTSDRAFELLRSASQELNRKLRDIAAEVEQTGVLPSRPSSQEVQTSEDAASQHRGVSQGPLEPGAALA